jgi:cation diffusion facilitator CzcD-associated flavoprotein CzcO
LSFEPNPNWTREYPGQEEILEYLVNIAHKYQLYKYIRFNTEVEEARWDDTTKTWQTKITRLGSKDAEFGKTYTITSDFLVSGVGQLNVPKYPDIKGIDTFTGKKMHSARWDWDYDLHDKKIGIIGNGATGKRSFTSSLYSLTTSNLYQLPKSYPKLQKSAKVSLSSKERQTGW